MAPSGSHLEFNEIQWGAACADARKHKRIGMLTQPFEKNLLVAPAPPWTPMAPSGSHLKFNEIQWGAACADARKHKRIGMLTEPAGKTSPSPWRPLGPPWRQVEVT